MMDENRKTLKSPPPHPTRFRIYLIQFTINRARTKLDSPILSALISPKKKLKFNAQEKKKLKLAMSVH